MAKRGRSPGFHMSDEHRGKIQNSNILKALIEHIEGRREMSATQVTAGLGLLRKVLPDLSAVENTGEIKHVYVARMPARAGSTQEWKHRYDPTAPAPSPTVQ